MAKTIYAMAAGAAIMAALISFFVLYLGKGSATISGPIANATAGQRISNFLIERVNPGNVTGLLYMEYPVARLNGTQYTVYVGNSVGYACDGTLATLIAIHGDAAAFVLNTTRPKYGCPI